MDENRFYRCAHCGNIVGLIHDAGVPLMCCGEEMEQLIPGESDGDGEKHIPVVTVQEDCVTVEVGTKAHPMTEEHSIQWVYLQTDRGGQRKKLLTGKDPVVVFSLCEEEPVAVYAYCNQHGLWKTEAK